MGYIGCYANISVGKISMQKSQVRISMYWRAKMMRIGKKRAGLKVLLENKEESFNEFRKVFPKIVTLILEYPFEVFKVSD